MKVIISRQADGELDDLTYYGALQWGRASALNYAAELRAACKLLGNQPEAERLIEGLSVPFRWILQGSHIIIYRVLEAQIEIFAIRHMRSDWAKHFRDQFG